MPNVYVPFLAPILQEKRRLKLRSKRKDNPEQNREETKGGFGECTLVSVFGTVVPFFVPSFRFWVRMTEKGIEFKGVLGRHAC